MYQGLVSDPNDDRPLVEILLILSLSDFPRENFAVVQVKNEGKNSQSWPVFRVYLISLDLHASCSSFLVGLAMQQSAKHLYLCVNQLDHYSSDYGSVSDVIGAATHDPSGSWSSSANKQQQCSSTP